MRTIRAFAASLSLLVLSAPLPAQLTEKQAVAQAKAASKAQLKFFKQAGKEALATLDSGLDALDASLQAGALPGEAADSMGAPLVEFLDSTNVAFGTAFYNLLSGAQLALIAFANGANLEGLYPADFYFGSGGLLDDGRAALVKEAAKLRAAASKRIEKSFAKAAKVANLAFGLELRLPTRELATGFNVGGGLGIPQGPSFDLLLSVSSLDAGQDGVLLLSGTTEDSGESVSVRRMNGADDVSVDVPAVDGRFTAFFSGLKEGGYAVSALQGTSPDTSTGSIGVR